MLDTYDAVTTYCTKVQQKLGKLVNNGRHAAHTQPRRISCRTRHALWNRATR